MGSSQFTGKDVVMVEISHHGATFGLTGSCHELTLTPGMKTGSDPVGSDPNFTRLNSVGILVDCSSPPLSANPSHALF